MTDGYKIKRGLIRVNGVRLPAEYQEVEYIENNGTAYILTGLNIKDGYRNLMKVRFTATQEPSQYPGISGGYLGYQSGFVGDGHIRLYLNGLQTNGKFNYGYLASYGDIGSGYTVGTDYEIDYSWISGNAFIKLNGTTLQSSSSTYSTSKPGIAPVGGTAHMDLSEGNQYRTNPGIRIYYSKFYNSSGTLVRDLVPCYRKSDNVIGMYDLVNDQFYTNSGTGSFTKGNDAPNMVEKQIYPAGRLPSAYQEVEYLETTGTQWINTNLFSGTNIQTEVKIGITKAAMNMPIFGCYTTYSTPRLYYHLTPYSNAWYFGYNGSEGHGGSINFVVGQTYEIVYNDENGYLNINGNNIVSVSGTTGYPGSTLGIAQRGTDHTGGDAPYYRYYYFKMYNKTTGEYERQMIPCYRKSDGVIGMYDLVNNQFYTNSGSGIFTKGPNV